MNLRKRSQIDYYEPEEPSLDKYLYCDRCEDLVYEYCSVHGPLLVVPDDHVPAKTDYPDYVPRAALTIPRVFLHIAPSVIPGAGLGVFSTITLPHGVRFGPYRGRDTTTVDSTYCWQLYNDQRGKSKVIDASDPNSSNWMRYVNCSRHWREQNLVAYQYQGQIYYRTIKIVPSHTELLVFYGSQFARILGIDLKHYNSADHYHVQVTEIPMDMMRTATKEVEYSSFEIETLEEHYEDITKLKGIDYDNNDGGSRVIAHFEKNNYDCNRRDNEAKFDELYFNKYDKVREGKPKSNRSHDDNGDSEGKAKFDEIDDNYYNRANSPITVTYDKEKQSFRIEFHNMFTFMTNNDTAPPDYYTTDRSSDHSMEQHVSSNVTKINDDIRLNDANADDIKNECYICGRVLSINSSLKRHLSTHNRALDVGLNTIDFKCNICGRLLCDARGLKNHLVSHSNSNIKPTKVNDDSSNGTTNKLLSDARGLKNHLVSHSNGNIKPTKVNDDSSNGTTNKCHICHRVLSSRRSLVRHINSTHRVVETNDDTNSVKLAENEGNANYYRCDPCNYKTLAYKDFLNHTRTEHSELCVSCNICDKRISRRHYTRHLRNFHK